MPMIRILDTKFGRNVLKKMKHNALNVLHAGVTTIRRVGEFFYTDVQLWDEINNNVLSDPNARLRFFPKCHGWTWCSYLTLVSDFP